MQKILLPILMIAGIMACQPNANNSQQTPKNDIEKVVGVIGDSAMVVSAHPDASKVGIEIIKQGGNAFDAAIAVQFALAVVYPRAGNIGGGGFAVYRENNGQSGTLDFREKAPKGSKEDMYLDKKGDVIPGLSTRGHLASGVPGSVDGMIRLHEKFGSLPFQQLIQPAIDLAYEGVILNASEAAVLNRVKDDLIEVNGRPIYMVREAAWEKGDTLVHKELANTLALIRDHGRDGFYTGIIADLIVKESRKGKGIISVEDLASYESKWRAPVVGDYKNYKVISMPPPSSGGVALLQLMQGSEAYDFTSMGHNTTESIHAMVELERRVYADRATYLGDPDHYDVPTNMLLDRNYNKERFSDISLKEKTASSDIKEGNVEIIESVETTHFSIVDSKGNAVSITTTLNSYFGSKVLVEGAGFFMNNEMDDFSSKPGTPNQFGLVGAEANAIKPEKRMLSSMTPTIVEKDGKLHMVLGTPGGSTIITSVYQTMLNVMEHNMTMQEAVNAAKFHHQWLPDMVLFEKDKFGASTLKDLEKIGHQIEYRSALGKVECILVLPDGQLEGAADYTRNESLAVGY